MANFVFNIAKGRVVELFNRVDLNDPANSALVVVAINTTASDAVLMDLDTLADVIADLNTVEVANTGYSRIVRTDINTTPISPDDINNRFNLDLEDFEFGVITNDNVNWTDLILCYDSDTTSGTDSNIVPLILFDFPVSIDGSAITANIDPAGIFRAS